MLAVAVALFAISTLITWSYYGQKAWNYLFGDTHTSTTIYRFVFLFFTVAGTLLTFGQVLAFADNFLFVCAFVNLLGVYLLLPVIKREMNDYLADRESGLLAELGLPDAEKTRPISELAGENQIVDASGRNRVAAGVTAEDLRASTGAKIPEEGAAHHIVTGDPDDDGFGRGAATDPYPPPHLRRKGRHEQVADPDDNGFGRGGATTPTEPPHRQPRGRHEADGDPDADGDPRT